MRIILFLLFIIPITLFSQNNKLEFFEALIDKTWKAEGKWGDGSTFKQELNYQYALDSTLIICNTKGFIDKKQTIFGERSHGIRKYDNAKNEIQFWEFDIFGGTTKGTVEKIDSDILYQYKYGEAIVTEIWEYLDDSTYNYQVGQYHEGKWEQIFLSTQFKASKNEK